MSIAALTHPSLLTPFQSLLRWFASGVAPARHPAPIAAKIMTNATDFVADYAGSTGTSMANRLPAGPVASAVRVRPIPRPSPRPLSRRVRVSRLVEEGQASANVGRMVISGRMEDVCAELDRLAGLSSPRVREITLH